MHRVLGWFGLITVSRVNALEARLASVEIYFLFFQQYGFWPDQEGIDLQTHFRALLKESNVVNVPVEHLTAAEEDLSEYVERRRAALQLIG